MAALVLAALLTLAVGGSMAQAATLKRHPDTTILRTTRGAKVRKAFATPSPDGAVLSATGCESNTLPANDDGSTEEVTLPFTLSYFGTNYSSLWVNNNGNVTFEAPLSTYTPFEINASTPPIIAPFLADVDTRGEGSGLVTYGTTTYQGHTAFCVDWPEVGYYDEHTDKLNTFQMLLVDRNDVAPGDFDIVFNYDQIQWETGDASEGVNGFGGVAPAVGFSNGDGDPEHFFELPGSLENGAFLDSNPATDLTTHSYGSPVAGRYVFHITDSGISTGGGDLSRPWPTQGYGYSFPNRRLSEYLVGSGLTLGSVMRPSGLTNTFSDWSQAANTVGGRARVIAQLGRSANGGVCFGLALSGGRFDSLTEPLFSPLQGRADPTWGSAGTGPSATMNLPEPSFYASSTYDEQFLELVSDDWASQISTQVNTSQQLQHYAYSDPVKGVAALRAQLESVMSTGKNLYDPSGKLSTSAGSGFAMIGLGSPYPTWVGHEILAYSMENLSNGGIRIDVWDNNFPGAHYAITVEPDGTWTYNAPYTNGDWQGTFSMTGAPGYKLGLLSALPLYTPTGLSFYPKEIGLGVGSGSLVDVGPGGEVSEPTDSEGNEVSIEPIASDDTTVGGDGVILDYPSGAGTLTVAGSEPSVDVRGTETNMTAEPNTPGKQMTVTQDSSAGRISTDDPLNRLSVSRGSTLISTSGVGGLEYTPAGSVRTTGDAGTLDVELEFVHDGETKTTTLYNGPATGSELTFSAAQIQEAEANPSATAGTPSASGGPMATGASLGYKTSNDTLSLRRSVKVIRGLARTRATCTGASPAGCTGVLQLVVTREVSVKRRTGGRTRDVKRAISIVLGTAHYHLAANTSTVVLVPISSGRLASAARSRTTTLPAKAIATPRSGAPLRAAVTLTLPTAAHKHTG